MCFAMFEQIHTGLHLTCASMKVDKRNLPAAFWRCWSFVDTVDRVREVAQAIPGLSKKTAEFRACKVSWQRISPFGARSRGLTLKING
jgi:hypothetical protein